MVKCRTLLSNGNYLFPSILPSVSPSAFSIPSLPLPSITLFSPCIVRHPSPSSLTLFSPFILPHPPSSFLAPSLPLSFLTLPSLPWPSSLAWPSSLPLSSFILPLLFTLLPPSLPYSLLHSSYMYLSFCPSLLDPLLAFALVLNEQCRK